MNNETVKVQLPGVEVNCPECDAVLYINGSEFEVCNPEYFAVSCAWCDDCDDSFMVGLTD